MQDLFTEKCSLANFTPRISGIQTIEDILFLLLDLMQDPGQTCGQTDREGGTAAKPRTQGYLALDVDLHGHENVLHDDAVEVQEADDARHPEIAGLGSQEVMDPVKIDHVHLIIFADCRFGGEKFPETKSLKNVYLKRNEV